jgi:hypothetical protein
MEHGVSKHRRVTWTMSTLAESSVEHFVNLSLDVDYLLYRRVGDRKSKNICTIEHIENLRLYWCWGRRCGFFFQPP